MGGARSKARSAMGRQNERRSGWPLITCRPCKGRCSRTPGLFPSRGSDGLGGLLPGRPQRKQAKVVQRYLCLEHEGRWHGDFDSGGRVYRPFVRSLRDDQQPQVANCMLRIVVISRNKRFFRRRFPRQLMAGSHGIPEGSAHTILGRASSWISSDGGLQLSSQPH